MSDEYITNSAFEADGDDEFSKHRKEAGTTAIPARHDSKVDTSVHVHNSPLDTDTSTFASGGYGAEATSAPPASASYTAATPTSPLSSLAQSASGTSRPSAQDAATIDPAITFRPITHKPHNSLANAGLHLQTNVGPSYAPSNAAFLNETPTIYETPTSQTPQHYSTISTFKPIMSSSLRSNLSSSSMASSLSPGSANSGLTSPFLAAMTDITPLPSPLVVSGSPEKWSRYGKGALSSHSRFSSLDETSTGRSSSLPPTSPISPTRRKKGYGSLMPTALEAAIANNMASRQENGPTNRKHSRNRSISDFVPEQLHNVRQRHVTLGSGDVPMISVDSYQMQREAYVAAQRGLTVQSLDPAKGLPSPPPSNASIAESDEADDDQEPIFQEDGAPSEYLQIHCGINNRKRRFRELRQLGQGTFSKVMLATTERLPQNLTPEIEQTLDPQQLVAIKIVEHGPAGGADEERIETSLKREVEMLRSVSHPSLVHLKACEYMETRTLLVLTYCPGGDLFELASEKRDVLTARMVQRIFSELMSAVRYLHQNWIVHRDIKLENVLVNLTPEAMRSLTEPESHPTPLITLTDLGLSRRVPDPPESPLLTTRCGSEDYAAPEILLGQPYDGRLTDGWALGVLLYALMEGRLPFDAPPGKPDRSRNTHRIARCDWIWCRFGDEDGEWDTSRPGNAEWEGGRLCVEGLLKKVRMGRKPLEEIEKLEWVQQGIQVEGGLQVRQEHQDDL